jgi:hypothetical protein
LKWDPPFPFPWFGSELLLAALRWRRFQDTENIKNRRDVGTEKYSTTGVPKMFPTVVSSLW